MHTIFRIKEIEQIDDRLWQVSLRLTSDNDQQLKHLTDHVRDELQLESGWCRLGILMFKMGELEKAEQIYKTILETISVLHGTQIFTELASAHNNLGMIQLAMRKYSTALLYLEKTLEIHQKWLPHNDSDLAKVNNNIGMIYQSMGEHSTALSYLKKTLEIQQKSLSYSHPDIGVTYNNIRMIYESMGEYSTAHSYFKKILEIWEKSLPHNHPNHT